MTLLGLLVLVVIAAITGSLGQALAGYSLGGCLVSAVVGLPGHVDRPALWLARHPGAEYRRPTVSGGLVHHRLGHLFCHRRPAHPTALRSRSKRQTAGAWFVFALGNGKMSKQARHSNFHPIRRR